MCNCLQPIAAAANSRAQSRPGSFADGAWHEIVLTFPVGLNLAQIAAYGLQVALKAQAPAGGPNPPPTTIVYLDDLWLE